MVIFWAIFLFILPPLIVDAEAALGVPAFTFRGRRIGAIVLFILCSMLGLWSAWTMACRGAGTPLPMDAPRELVIEGPYRIVRNPMAVAGLGQAAAVGVWLGSWSVLAYVLTGGVVWHILVRPAEEADLARRFGPAYEDYRRRVGLWLPRLRHPSS